MTSKFDIKGVKFDLLSYVPDEVLQAFHLLYDEAYAAGVEAGKASATKVTTKAKGEAK